MQQGSVLTRFMCLAWRTNKKNFEQGNLTVEFYMYLLISQVSERVLPRYGPWN